MKKIIVTNNQKVFEKYKDTFEIVFFEQGSYMEVLNKTRDKVHEGCKILTHPMAGSLKPNQTPYKSVILTEFWNEGYDSCSKSDNSEKTRRKTHYDSVVLIENTLAAAEKFLKFKATPKWSEKILKDFQTVDLSLIENVINNPMFNFGAAN